MFHVNPNLGKINLKTYKAIDDLVGATEYQCLTSIPGIGPV